MTDLETAALAAKALAYAPYSKFQVGAAIRVDGEVFTGVNVENASYPLSVCAERNAVAMAVNAGHRRIDAIAIVGGEGRPAAPCGGCRQVLAEFCAGDAPVLYAASGGRSVTTDVSALLPDAFGPADLIKAAKVGVRGGDPAGIRRGAARVRGAHRRRRRRATPV